MFVKGDHEKQFAYEAHTACDDRGFVLGVEVTGGNVHDSVAWDKVYDKVSKAYKVNYAAMDAGYKTPWIFKKTIDTYFAIYKIQRKERPVQTLGIYI